MVWQCSIKPVHITWSLILKTSDPANATVDTVFFGDAPSVGMVLCGTEVLCSTCSEWLVHINLTNNSGGQVSQRIISFISADGELPDFVLRG